MFHTRKQSISPKWLGLALIALALILGFIVVNSYAQTNRNHAATAGAAQATEQPLYSAYRGVMIGMTAEETRQKLGAPAQSSAEIDLYDLSPTEMAQVYYDQAHRVKAISVDFFGGTGAPTASAVVGAVETKPDGSIYKLVRYPRLGFWVSYNRTAGNPTIVSVTIQKIEH